MSKPLFWMDETGGKLAPAVMQYMEGVRRLAPDQVELLRLYLQQWIARGAWRGATIPELRRSIRDAHTQTAIREWLHEADLAGIDPF